MRKKIYIYIFHQEKKFSFRIEIEVFDVYLVMNLSFCFPKRTRRRSSLFELNCFLLNRINLLQIITDETERFYY